MKTRSVLVLSIILMHLSVIAQVKIGNNPTSINSASLLELESSNQGFVLPRVSIDDVSSYLPLSSGLLTGTIVYNIKTTTTGGSGAGIYYWDGTKWVFISTGSAVSSSAWLLTGNSGLSSSSNFIGTTDAIDFVAKTANTERMRILGAANGSSKAGWIGMGVIVPRSSLDVTGHYTNKNVITIQNTSASGFSSVDMLDSSGNLAATFGYGNLGTGAFAGKAYFNGYGNDFLFSRGGSNDLLMKGSNGYVGINTGTPSERLHVVGNIYLSGAFMPGGNAGTTGYVLTSAGAGVSPTWNSLNSLSWSLTGNNGTSYATNFIGTTDNVSMRFRTNNVQRMIIDSLGKVGIGISNPSYALSVLSANNPLYLSGLQATAALSTDSVLTIYNGIVKKTPFSAFASSTTNTLTLSTNTLTSTVNGIAATSSAVSSVSNISSANNLSTIVNGVAGSIAPIINSNTNALTQAGGLITTVNGVAATTSIASGTVNNVLGYNASGSTVYQSLNNINLSSAWNIAGNAGTNYATNFLGTTDNVSMRFRTNNIQRMIIDSLGKTGIGTSTPTERLDVSGNIRFSGALMPNNNAGIAGQFLISTGAGNAPTWFDASNYAWQLDGNPVTSIRKFGTTTNYDVPFITNNIERMRLTAGGLLGIGTTNPGYTLSVLAPSNPLYLSGVQATAALSTDSVLTIYNGIVKKTPFSSFASPTTNTLTLSTNTLTSTVNGIAATSNAVSSVSSISSANNISTIVNGVAGSTAPIINSNTETWTQSGGLTAAINGISANVTPANGTVSSVLGYDAGGTPVYQSASGILNGTTTNTLTLSTNALTSTVNGIAATSNAVSGVSNISNANKLSTTVNGVNGTIVSIINSNANALTQAGGLVTTVNGVAATTSIASGTVSNILGYNASGNPVYQSLSNINLTTAWNLTGNSGTNYATNFLGTKDNVSMRFRTNNVQRMIIDSLGNVGIGISNPSYALSVLSANNPLYLSGVQATSTFSTDSVLTINAGIVKKTPSSLLTNNVWNLTGNAATNSALNFLGTTDNHPLQFRVNNSIAGYIDSTGGLGNSYFGSNAGYSNTSGNGNTLIGAGADSANTTGSFNIALGYQTGYNNISGSSNIFTGYQGGYNNTTGSGNLFSGFQSGYKNTTGQLNIFSGYWSGYLNTTGSNNGFFGYLSGFSNTTGSGNIFLGSQTGSTNTTGSNNTLIGSNSNVLSAALTNATAIGYNAKVALSNSLVLGDTATGNAVNVGIGVSNPLKRLHIDAAPITSAGTMDSLKIDNLATSASTYNKAILVIDSATGYVSKQNINVLDPNNNWSLTGNSGTNYSTNFLGTTDNVSLRFRTNNIERMIIDSLGRVGIGSSSFDPYNPGKLLIDYGTTTSNTIANFKGSIDDYFQINLQNKSATGNASTDFVATADDGTDSTYYVDMGINSSKYAFAIDNWGQAHDAYLYSNSKNLFIGTQAVNSDVVFLVGGGRAVTNAALRIKGSNGVIVVGKGEASSTPIGNILRGPTGVGTNIAGGSLTITGGGATGTATGGNLYLGSGVSSGTGSSGILTLSTSNTERMRIDASGNVGIGTTNPSNALSVLAASNPLYLSGVQATSTFSTDSILTINAGIVKKAPYSSLTGGSNWSLTGNSGTNYINNFLGTTDNVSMRFRTNNLQRMIIDSLGRVGIGTGSPSSDLTLYQSSGSGNAKGFTFTGNSIGGPNSGTGFLMTLGYNTTGNKQLWLGDADYAGNASGSFARFVTTGAVFPVIDAVSGDNASRRYLAFGVAGDVNSGVIFGADNTAVSPGSQVWDNGNMTIGTGYKSYAAPSNGLLVQGNVGIGTTNPSNALSVLAASNPLYLSGVQATSSFSTDSILTIKAGVVKAAPYSSLPTASGGGWQLTGNSISAGNFLGTTNAQALVLKANNVQMGYFDGNISSLALGVGAINNSSDHNVAIGYNASTNNQYTLALGYSASATGVRSVAIGNGGSATTASGSEAVAIGYNANASNVQTVAMGYQAQATGQFGLALGYNPTASGVQSVAIGYQAQATQQYSNAIGYQAQATGLQSTAIGYQAQTSQSNTILLGNAATGNLYVGIGTATPTAKLHIVGGTTSNYPLQMTGLPTGTAGTDNILTINSSGVVGYITPATFNSNYWGLNGNAATSGNFLGTTNTTPLQFKFNSTAAGYLDANNTSFGTSATATSGTLNTAIGYSANAANNATSIGASSVASAQNNTAVGNSATANNSTNETAIGASATASQQNNTAVGYNAQAINNAQATAIGTTATANGYQSTAIGYGAQAISNAQTTALGATALANAQYNTAVGFGAQAINNSQATAVGYNSKSTSQYGVAMGYNAQAINNAQTTAVGSSTTASGAVSSAFGYDANASASQTTSIGGESDATAQNNTALGYNAQATTNTQTTAIGANTSATGSNSTAIGYGATTSQTNAIVLGTSTNNVGIGTSTPNTNTKLDVAGNFKMGTAGTVLASIIKTSGNSGAVTMSVGATSTTTIPAAGANTNSNVILNPRGTLPSGIVIAYYYVSSANTITIGFTSGGYSGSFGAQTFDITIIQ